MRSELAELRAELRASRDDAARAQRRLELLEAQCSIKNARAAETELPDLSVVKLRPKALPVPKIRTDVAIVEPAPDAIDLLASDLPKAPADAAYDKALASLKTGNVEGAIEALQKFAAHGPGDPKADNALYYAGVGYMGLGEFESAERVFHGLLRAYPAGDAVPDAWLKLGECRARQGRSMDAQRAYQELVATHPGTSAALAAQSRLSSSSP